jgi:hypothetical protein
MLSNKLLESLAVRKRLQDLGVVAIASSALSRTHRQRLLRSGFIREVMKGWYIPSARDEPAGEPAAWVARFWSFASGYLGQRFGDDWCLGPGQSLKLHVGDFTVPRRLIVRSPRGGNKPVALLHETALIDLRLNLPDPRDIETLDGLRLMGLAAALIACPPGSFAEEPIVTRAALALVGDASLLVSRLLEGGHSVVAGRLAGALRNIGRERAAERVVVSMRAAGYTVNERDPFADRLATVLVGRSDPPEVDRLRMMWQRLRPPILKSFPPSPGPVPHPAGYLQAVETGFTVDAFHSLSLEGFRVNAQLIHRARAEEPSGGPADRDALAARGYWLAFQAVKKSIERVLAGDDAGAVVCDQHGSWYRALFAPRLAPDLLDGPASGGYRHGPGVDRFSMHIPARHEVVSELMRVFFELLQEETEPGVRVVMGHFAFLYIRPYVDRNNLIGRFLMNVLRAAGGYPWLVIPLSRRVDYRAALESARIDANIVPLANFLAGPAKPPH